MSETKKKLSMRDFFGEELKTLYLKTGLQQLAKLSEMPDGNTMITQLKDLMVIECKKFPHIADEDKQRVIQENMMTDTDFQGFNPKIVLKWLTKEHHKIVQKWDEKQLAIQNNIKYHEPAKPEVAQKYIDQLMKNFSDSPMDFQIAGTTIRDGRVQALKNDLSKLECKHVTLIDTNDGKVCNDCGKLIKQ